MKEACNSNAFGGGSAWTHMEVKRARTGKTEFYRSYNNGSLVELTKEQFLSEGGCTAEMQQRGDNGAPGLAAISVDSTVKSVGDPEEIIQLNMPRKMADQVLSILAAAGFKFEESDK